MSAGAGSSVSGQIRVDFVEKWKSLSASGAALGSDYQIEHLTPKPLVGAVRLDAATGEVLPAVFNIYSVSKPGHQHNVCLIYSPFTDLFTLHCGAGFFEDGSRTRKALTADPSLLRDTFEARSADYEKTERSAMEVFSALCVEMGSSMGAFQKSDVCNFWKSGGVCKHSRGLIRSLLKSNDLEIALDTMEQVAHEWNLVPSVKPSRLKAVEGFEKLDRYAFVKHVMIEGDKGSGKTVMAQSFSKAKEIEPIVVVGHEGVESTDLLGHFVRLPDGSMAWKDGKVAQAFRRAEACEPTILIIDEILRIPQRHLNILVGSLSPDSDGFYRLNTGRPLSVDESGVIAEESLRCHKSMLWVVATTNIGAGYAVDEMDSALSDRFIRMRQDTTRERIVSVLTEKVVEKGFSGKVVPKLVEFWEKMGKAREQGELTQLVNLRHLCEAVEFSRKEEEIPGYIRDMTLNWLDRDTLGRPIAAQAKMVEKAIAVTVGVLS